MLDKLIYFRTHYLAIIWIVGLGFGAFMFLNFEISNYKFKQLVKKKKIAEEQRINKLKDKVL